MIQSLLEKIQPYYDTLLQYISAFKEWYIQTNVTTEMIPGLMYVPVLDFILICVGILLGGWIVLKNLN